MTPLMKLGISTQISSFEALAALSKYRKWLLMKTKKKQGTVLGSFSFAFLVPLARDLA